MQVKVGLAGQAPDQTPCQLPKMYGPGHGTTISIKLPLAAVKELQTDSSRVGERPIRPRPFTVDLTGVRVLVVDDEADASAMVALVLRNSNASAVTANGVDDALRLSEGEHFDVLVSDVSMPGKDGFDLIKAVRRRHRDCGGNMPAVALTAFARAEDRIQAMFCGYQMHLSKPVEPWELVAAVGSLAGRFGDK